MSWLEQLCLKSFADAGHRVTLFSYAPVEGLPEGVEAGDAGAFFPGEPLLQHAKNGSPAIHADMWRLNMLAASDAIWVDADVYCRRPFAFGDEVVVGWEKPGQLCNAVLGLPKGSPALERLLEFFADPFAIAPWLKPWQRRELEAARDAGRPVHMTEQKWGFTGPASVTWALAETGEIEVAKTERVFYPVSFKDRNQMFRSKFDIEEGLGDDTVAIHLWARRLKARLAERESGVPRKGSLLDKLLARHDIDPAAAPIDTPHAQLDVSMFSTEDHMNFVLQRSEILNEVPRVGRIVKAWSEGEPEPLRDAAIRFGDEIPRRVARVTGAEYEDLKLALGLGGVRAVADIGCGYGVFDLFAARDLGALVTLIDVEANDRRQFGFSHNGAGYSNLDKARDFLTQNGVPRDRIRTLNPDREDVLTAGPVDLAVSFLACGFHFPVEVYMPFFERRVNTGGLIVLDLRRARAGEQIDRLSDLGKVRTLSEKPNAIRVAVTRT